MVTIVTRAGKGSPLTNTEVDTNFTNLNSGKVETSAVGTIAAQNANNVAITGGSISGITDLAVADGGTGLSSLTANNVILGNGASAVQFVAPGASGNVLASNGTTWASTAPTGTWTTKFHTADQSVTSSTTYVDVSGLSFAVAANTSYKIRVVLDCSVSASGGIKVQITGPASPTQFRGAMGHSNNFNGVSGTSIAGMPWTTGLGQVLVIASTTNSLTNYRFECLFVNGANAGTINFQFAQYAANATTTTIYRGSYIEYAVIA